MHILRRVLTFWLTCDLLVAGFAAWETWLLGRSEPDFGAPLGNFAMVLGVYSLLALPAALCHGIAAFLLRKTLVSSSPAHMVISSALSAAAFLVLLYVTGSVPLGLPVEPLLRACAIALPTSLLIIAIASKLPTKRHVRAA